MEKVIGNNAKSKINVYIENIKNYLIDLYSSKYVFIKLIIFFVVSILVFSLSFGVREIVLNRKDQTGDFIKGFLDINVVGNPGIAFSIGDGSSVHLINFIQLIPVIISIIAILFTKMYAVDVGLTLLIAGGLSNVIDRAVVDKYVYISNIETENAVVDYIYFSFIPNSAIFNVPDVFVIVGVITICISVVVKVLKEYIKEKKANKNGQPKN